MNTGKVNVELMVHRHAVGHHTDDRMGQAQRKSEGPLFDIEHLKKSKYSAVPKNETYAEIKSKHLKKKMKTTKPRMVERDVNLLNGEKHAAAKKDAGVDKNGGFERRIKKRAEEAKVNGSVTKGNGSVRETNEIIRGVNGSVRDVNGSVNGGFRGVIGGVNHRKTQSLFIEVGNGQRKKVSESFS